MINVSSQFKEELNKGNRNYLAYVDITLKDGTKLNLDSSKIWSNSFCIEDNVSNPSTFDIGSAIINKGSFALNNIYEDFSRYDFDGARVHMAVGLKLSDGRIEKVNFGYYNVSETRYNGSIITLECLDDMTKFDKKYSLSTLRYPATLMEIVDDACRVCNVSNGMISFNNSGYVVNERPSDEALTCRQVLAWVGQIACEWFKMDKSGRLTHGWYSINPRKNIGSLNSMNIATDDVVITGLKIDEYDKDSQEKVVSHLEGVEGYVLHIQNNKLIQKGQAQVVGQLIGQRVIGLRFRPLNVTFQSDPTIEAGDSATVVDYKGNAYETFVTGMKFTAGSSQMIECGAETAQRNSADRFSQATQGYIEAHKEIEKEKTDREKAMQALNDTLAASSGMYVTEEVQPDGSTITYLHDKPTKAESKNVIKITADAVGISNDGGKTYPYGLFLTGDVITKILYAQGIDADYIKTGIIRSKKGNNFWNLDTGEFRMGSSSVQIDGKPIDQAIKDQTNNALGDIEIGGRNLLLGSDVDYINSEYSIASYTMTEKMVEGEAYTCRIWGSLANEKTNFGLWLNGDLIHLCDMADNHDGTYSATFMGKSDTSDASKIWVYAVPSSTYAESSINKIKLEKGIKATDYTLAPEETKAETDEALGQLSEALSKANTAITNLNNTISMLVTDEKGNSLMTQKGDGWVFNMGAIQKTLKDTVDGLEKASADSSEAKKLADETKSMAEALNKKTAFIQMTILQNGQPAILLGQSNSKFKLRITNTSIDFLEGDEAVAYISNQILYITKAIIKDELQIGDEKGWIIKRRANGNLGIRWSSNTHTPPPTPEPPTPEPPISQNLILDLDSADITAASNTWVDRSSNKITFDLTEKTPDVTSDGLYMASCKVHGTKPVTLSGAFSYLVEMVNYNAISSAIFSFNQFGETKYCDSIASSNWKINGYSGGPVTQVSVPTNTMFKMAIVRDAVGETKIYKNGVFAGSYDRGLFNANGEFDLVLGASSWGGYPNHEGTFRIKRLKIYNNAITDSEISSF